MPTSDARRVWTPTFRALLHRTLQSPRRPLALTYTLHAHLPGRITDPWRPRHLYAVPARLVLYLFALGAPVLSLAGVSFPSVSPTHLYTLVVLGFRIALAPILLLLLLLDMPDRQGPYY
jgi:hypothetical protein